MKAKNKKRGRGRPKLEPKSGPELRAQALENLRIASERRASEEQQLLPPPPDPGEVIDEASAVTRKHKYTIEEMNELREKLDFVYQKYIEEKWEQEAEMNKEINERLRNEALNIRSDGSPVKMMSPEDWFSCHGLRSDGTKKRGPAPKEKKLVYDLEPGEKGTAVKPSEPIDVDALAAELESRMMDDYIEQQKHQPQQLKGKRVRGSERQRLGRRKTKSFWI